MAIFLLGTRVDNVSKTETMTLIQGYLASLNQHTIFTPNPEMLVAAYQSHVFRDAINNSSLNVCDGFGMTLVSAQLSRYPGIDLFLDICALATQEKKRVFLLGSNSDKHVQKTQGVLEKKYPGILIVGTHPGLPISVQSSGIRYDAAENETILRMIQAANPDILFVAFGQIKQECWIAENLSKLPRVRIAMGVGGAFDFVAGRVSRAPQWMRSIGLEWLWRLLRQPWRLKRIITAVVVFPLLVLWDKMKQQ